MARRQEFGSPGGTSGHTHTDTPTRHVSRSVLRSPPGARHLLVPEGDDRIEAGGAYGEIDPEEDSDDGGRGERHPHRLHGEEHREAEPARVRRLGHPDGDPDADPDP